MDSEDKRKQAERAMRGMRKVKSLTERKENARRTKENKAQRKGRSRARQDWSDFDEETPFDAFERMQRVSENGADRAKGRLPNPADHDWLVVAVHLGKVDIRREDKVRSAHLGGARLEGGPPVVSDRIAIMELPQGECRVVSIAERTSFLIRQDPGNHRKQKMLAANVDVGLIALAPQADGSLRIGIVERLRVALRAGLVEPLVVITKVDRHTGDGRAALDRDVKTLRDSGLQCHPTSSLSGEGILELRESIAGRTCVVVGHSGVGKSTLLNALDSEHERDTGGVREADDRGRHTTTSSSMFPLVGGGWLIDTPGIRQFGLSHVSPEEVFQNFPTLVDLAQACPRGCKHQQTDCAIGEAAREDPGVHRELSTYLRILGDLACEG